MVAETFLQLITDPNHIAFELTLEALTGLLVYPAAKALWRRALRRHDATAHGKEDS